MSRKRKPAGLSIAGENLLILSRPWRLGIASGGYVNETTGERTMSPPKQIRQELGLDRLDVIATGPERNVAATAPLSSNGRRTHHSIRLRD